MIQMTPTNLFPMIPHSELVEQILLISADMSKTKVTESLKSGWKMTLKGIPNNILIKGYKIYNQEKTDNYLPHPGEIRGICRGIQLSIKREKALIDNTQQLIDYNSIPQIAEQAKKITGNLESKPNINFPSIILYETLNLKTGNIEKLITPKHIEFEFFSDQCYLRHRKKPYKIRHAYRAFQVFKDKDENGNFTRAFQSCVECEINTPEAEPITIGYLN